MTVKRGATARPTFWSMTVPKAEQLAVTARRIDSIAVEIVAVTDWGSACGLGSTVSIPFCSALAILA